MKIKDLKDVAYSTHGYVQWAVLYSQSKQEDVEHATVDHIIKEYGDLELVRLVAAGDQLVLEVQ